MSLEYDEDNVFYKILKGDLPCDKIYENDHVLAFNDIAPVAPIHVLVIPKGKYVSFEDFDSSLYFNFFNSVKNVLSILNLKNGYRIITNSGTDGGQIVFHFHVHIIAGTRLGSLLNKA